jgi:hypothetical protein
LLQEILNHSPRIPLRFAAVTKATEAREHGYNVSRTITEEKIIKKIFILFLES